MNPTHDFSGQMALVTGAGGGMGLDTARALPRAVPPSCSPTPRGVAGWIRDRMRV